MKRLLLLLMLCACPQPTPAPPRLIVIDVTRGQKVVNTGFSLGGPWYAARRALIKEEPEDTNVYDFSPDGVLQATYTLHETALMKPLPIWRPGERP